MVKRFQRTLILLKPGAVARGLAGRILSRFEEKGLVIVAMKFMQLSKAQARKHYGEHKGKPFFDGLVEFITSRPIVAVAFEGLDAVAVCRKLVGSTCGREAEPGTIRGDFGMSDRCNLVHASDCPAAAKREIKLFFKRGELVLQASDVLTGIYDFSGPDPI